MGLMADGQPILGPELFRGLEYSEVIVEAEPFAAGMATNEEGFGFKGLFIVHQEVSNMIIRRIAACGDLCDERQSCIPHQMAYLAHLFRPIPQINFSGIVALLEDPPDKNIERLLVNFPCGFGDQDFQWAFL